MDFSMFDLIPSPCTNKPKLNSPYTYSKSPARGKTPESPDSIRWEHDEDWKGVTLKLPVDNRACLHSMSPTQNSDVPCKEMEKFETESFSIPSIPNEASDSHLPNIGRKSMVGPVRFWPKKYRPSRCFVEVNSYWEKRKIWKSFKPFLQANPDLQQETNAGGKLKRKPSLLQKQSLSKSKPMIKLPSDVAVSLPKDKYRIEGSHRLAPELKRALNMSVSDAHLLVPSGSGQQSAEATPLRHSLRHSISNATFEQISRVKAPVLKSQQTVPSTKNKQMVVRKPGIKRSL